jgi:hypothetical protein
MKKVFRLVTIPFAIILVATSISPASSAISLLNKPCPKEKATKVNNGNNLVCKSIAGKKVWKKDTKSEIQPVIKSVPLAVPEFSLKYDNNIVTATLIVNAQEIKNEKIEGAEVIIYAKTLGNYNKIGSTNWDGLTINTSRANLVNFRWQVPDKYKGSELAVEVRYENSLGQGEKALKAIFIPSPVPTASPSSTPTPTPTPTVTPTPVPVTSAMPQTEIGCSVNYLSALPYASQRIAILSMSWEKDSSGYVFANATMRNDNSMSLRLVEFSFYILHKGSLIYTTSTLEGNHHFFIQGDAKFNSTDGASGPWLPGQTRTFKMPTNQMLECRSITVTSTGFNVKQGIGAN